MSINNNNENKNSNLKNKINKNNEILINLKNNLLSELKIIAISYGISLNNKFNKQEIIENIKLVINRQQKLFEKLQFENNLNSFNKSIIQLKIKDGIESSELLFWKIFRNKFLFRKIMSFMDIRFSVLYDSITLVSKMLKNNQISILRDKVKRNQYLTFNKLNDNIINQDYDDDLSLIFKTINNNNEQDYQFYKSFFKNYNKYIINFNNNKSILFNQILKSKCKIALKVLINEFNYQPNNENLIFSINKVGSIKLFKFISSQIKDLYSSISFQQLLLNNIQNNDKSIKILNYLINSNKIKFTLNDMYQFMNSIKLNENYSLKSLILIYKLISKISNEKQQLSFNLTKQELNLPLSDELNQVESKKEMIKNLLDLYYSFCKIEIKPEFYHLYFTKDDVGGSNYGNGSNGFKRIIKLNKTNSLNEITILSLQFGNFNLLEYTFKNRKDDNYLKEISSFLFPNNDGHSKELLFTHCKNKQNQINFINLIIEKLLLNDKKINTTLLFNNNLVNRNEIIDKKLLLCLLISNDDLELIKLFSLQFQNIYSTRIDYPINHFIKSIPVLEFLFKNYQNSSNFSLDNILTFRNLELLKYYKGLLKKSNDEIIIPYINTYSAPILNENLKYLIENGKLNNFKISHINSLYQAIDENIPLSEKLVTFKTAFYNFQFKKEYCHNFIEIKFSFTSHESFKFLDWLFENHSNYLTFNHDQGTLCFNPELFWFTGKFDNIINGYIPISTQKYEQLNSFTSLLNNLKSIKQNNNIENFKIYLQDAAQLGRLKTFETMVYQNCNWILLKNQNDNDQLLSNNDIDKLLFISLENSHLELSEFLLQLLSINKNDFIKYSSKLSFEYFKDNKNIL